MTRRGRIYVHIKHWHFLASAFMSSNRKRVWTGKNDLAAASDRKAESDIVNYEGNLIVVRCKPYAVHQLLWCESSKQIPIQSASSGLYLIRHNWFDSVRCAHPSCFKFTARQNKRAAHWVLMAFLAVCIVSCVARLSVAVWEPFRNYFSLHKRMQSNAKYTPILYGVYNVQSVIFTNYSVYHLKYF